MAFYLEKKIVLPLNTQLPDQIKFKLNKNEEFRQILSEFHLVYRPPIYVAAYFSRIN